MNYIQKFMEDNELEVGEEFEIKKHGDFKFFFNSEYDLMRKPDSIHSRDTTLLCLLNGEYEIIKLPWKPKPNETYYSIDDLGRIERTEWGGSAVQEGRYSFGSVFQTYEQAFEASLQVKSLLHAIRHDEEFSYEPETLEELNKCQ